MLCIRVTQYCLPLSHLFVAVISRSKFNLHWRDAKLQGVLVDWCPFPLVQFDRCLLVFMQFGPQHHYLLRWSNSTSVLIIIQFSLQCYRPRKFDEEDMPVQDCWDGETMTVKHSKEDLPGPCHMPCTSRCQQPVSWQYTFRRMSRSTWSADSLLSSWFASSSWHRIWYHTCPQFPPSWYAWPLELAARHNISSMLSLPKE